MKNYSNTSDNYSHVCTSYPSIWELPSAFISLIYTLIKSHHHHHLHRDLLIASSLKEEVPRLRPNIGSHWFQGGIERIGPHCTYETTVECTRRNKNLYADPWFYRLVHQLIETKTQTDRQRHIIIKMIAPIILFERVSTEYWTFLARTPLVLHEMFPFGEEFFSFPFRWLMASCPTI